MIPNWKPIVGQFWHFCEFVDGQCIDEHEPAILKCRCYQTREFFDAQDRMAVAIDAKREPRDE